MEKYEIKLVVYADQVDDDGGLIDEKVIADHIIDLINTHAEAFITKVDQV